MNATVTTPSAVRLPLAVTQTEAAPKMSERYVQIQTAALLPELERMGFEVAAARMHKTRGVSADQPFARHWVDLRIPSVAPVCGTVPRILIENSHDGSSALRVSMGAYRFICSNGLVIGTHFAQESVRHAGMAAEQALERIAALARNTQPLFDSIERWSKIELHSDVANEFARLASVLRWGDAERFSPELVLSARREEDVRPDLWTVFNRVQENTVRGGFRGLTRSGRNSTARPLNDDAEYNRQLWTLAEDFAEAVA